MLTIACPDVSHKSIALGANYQEPSAMQTMIMEIKIATPIAAQP